MKKKLTIGILDFSGIIAKNAGGRRSRNEADILYEKVEELGHTPKLYKADECQIFFDGEKTLLLEKNEPIESCDVLIPRVDLAGRLDVELSILKQFQLMDIPVVNGYLPTVRAKNKLRTIQLLTEKAIPVPKTVVVRQFEYVDAAVKVLGGYPLILKSAFGSYGCGVVIVESSRSLYSSLDLLGESTKTPLFLMQEFIEEADGSDYRAFVINNEVVASMQRQAKSGDFRSNLHLGGHAQKFELTNEEKDIVLKAVKALGLQVAGVDLLRSKNGPLVMEVNSNPGFIGLVEATQVDVGKKFVEYAIEFAKSHLASKEKKQKIKA